MTVWCLFEEDCFGSGYDLIGVFSSLKKAAAEAEYRMRHDDYSDLTDEEITETVEEILSTGKSYPKYIVERKFVI
jgi:hypothetical protein